MSAAFERGYIRRKEFDFAASEGVRRFLITSRHDPVGDDRLPADRLRPSYACSLGLHRDRPQAFGKFFYAGGEKLSVKGVTYGAFEPDADGHEYWFHDTIERDFELMAAPGSTPSASRTRCRRVSLLDAAERHGL